MKIKIGKTLKQNCSNGTNNLILIILLSIILCGQSYAQWEWERTNLPITVKVNSIVIRDSSIFAGTNGDGIFVSTNNGENWKSINEGLQSKVVHTILVNGKTLSARQSPLDSEGSLTTGQTRIFAGTETGVSVSTDNSENWRSINSGLSGLGVWSLGISADTVGDTTIFAGSSNGVYSSTDRGENWKVTGLSTTIMPVHSLIILNRYIFAATFSEGLFISQDNGLTWKNTIITRKDESLPEMIAPICSITKSFGSFSHYNIIAGSYGGLYYMDYKDPGFNGDISLTNLNAPILCFANRNDTLFTAQSGYFFWLYYNFIGLKFDFEHLNIPYLENYVYSLALNNGYIFAGTEDGIWRFSYPGAITGVESPRDVPAGFVLEQNYPNPFNPATAITYRLPVASNVTLIVYDLLGRPVATLVNERQNAGSHSVKFDAGGLPSGVYFYRLQTGSFVRTKKMILLQ